MPEREEQQLTSLDFPGPRQTQETEEPQQTVNPRLKSEFMQFTDEDFLYWN